MSGGRWIRLLVGGLVTLILGIAGSKGDNDECRLCCILQGSREDLNCTWTSDSNVPLSASLQCTSNPQNLPQYYTIPSGQSWLLIRRENLTKQHSYQLSVNDGTWTETLNFTYCHGCDNVFIGAPILNSSVEVEDEMPVVVVTWEHIKENSHPCSVELRYRILGASQWVTVNSSDMEPDSYVMLDPEPYMDYEFQIRYLPDERQKSRSLWSESYHLTTLEEVPDGTLDIWRRMEDNSLFVIWKPLPRHTARGKILGYNVTYVYNNSRQTTEMPCCNVTLPPQATHVCVRARNSMGLGPPSYVTPMCSVAVDVGDFGGTAWGDPSGSIAVRWEEGTDYGGPAEYVLDWRRDDSSEINWTRSMTANQTLVLPGEFTAGVLYIITVHAVYNDSCAEVLSTKAYSREEAPVAAPIFCIHKLSSSDVFISWEELPKHHLRGKLKHYNIYVNSTSGSHRHTVHGKNMTLHELLPGTVYHTFMTASTAAGEGVPSAGETFQTMGVRNLHPLTLPFVSLICVCILMVALLIHPHVRKTLLHALWPRIPKPEDKFNGYITSINAWESQQTPPNPPICDVEEMELAPPASPPPVPCQPVMSGYEKHFMPTPEEVMGLR